MDIRLAEQKDTEVLNLYDKHINKKELKTSISLNRVYVAEIDGELVGWLRYNLFWDNTPFMNMLFVLDGFRGKGLGKQLTAHWEERMRKEGYKKVLTSTVSSECSQHFYVHLGYRAIGSFLQEGEPLEIIMEKNLYEYLKK